MQKERTIIDFEIIWKKINHSITEDEEVLLDSWLKESPAHQRYMDNAMKYYLEGSVFEDTKTVSEKAWEALNLKERRKSSNHSGWIIALSAAAIAIFLIVTYLLPDQKIGNTPLVMEKAIQIKAGTNKAVLILNDGSVHDLTVSNNLVLNEGGSEIKSQGDKLEYTKQKNQPKEIKYNTLSVPRGGEFFLQLTDGTKVWLNSESELRYPVQFSGKERRVELTGEAFFEVARNEKAPFLVESGEQTVKVLGTEFNISSYKDDPLIYTTLVKGSVEVFLKNMPEINQILAPNEQSLLNKLEAQISKRIVDPYSYVAWKDGRFVFQDQNLGDIMKTLSKWYNVEVTFASDELRDFRFTGDLQRYTDFSEVLRKIGKTNEVKFIIENNKITIR
jgi:ferric-dicitrate binding protein FerR (iron transport regulator)